MDRFYLGAVNRNTLFLERVALVSAQEIDALYTVDRPTLLREIAILGAAFEDTSIFLRRVRRVKMERHGLLGPEATQLAQFLQSKIGEVYVALSTSDPNGLDRATMIEGQKLIGGRN